MGQINVHRVNIRKRVPIGKGKLEKGMIVETSYAPMDEKTGKPKGSKKYMLVILNTGYKKKIHALSLDNFSPNTLSGLAMKTGLKYMPAFQKTRKLDLSKLVMDVSSKRFYLSNLKKDIATKYGASYRTMFEKSFKTITLVDYRFRKDVEDAFLLLEDRVEKQNGE